MGGIVQGTVRGGAHGARVHDQRAGLGEQGPSPRRLKSTRANASGEFGLSLRAARRLLRRRGAGGAGGRLAGSEGPRDARAAGDAGHHRRRGTQDDRSAAQRGAPVIAGSARARGRDSQARDELDAGDPYARRAAGRQPAGPRPSAVSWSRPIRSRARCAARVSRSTGPMFGGGRTAITADDGSFAFDRVPAGTLHACARPRTDMSRWVTAPLRTRRPGTGVLTSAKADRRGSTFGLPRGAVITASIVDVDGLPAQGIEVTRPRAPVSRQRQGERPYLEAGMPAPAFRTIAVSIASSACRPATTSWSRSRGRGPACLAAKCERWRAASSATKAQVLIPGLPSWRD